MLPTKAALQLIIPILLASCSQFDKAENAQTNNAPAAIHITDAEANPIGGHPGYAPGIVMLTSEDQKDFWNSVVTPVLKGEKEKILATIKLPVLITNTDKSAEITTKSDLTELYNKLLKPDFTEALSYQSYEDISGYKNSDTTWCSFSMSKAHEQNGSVVILEYIKTGGRYTLKSILDTGADAYGMK